MKLVLVIHNVRSCYNVGSLLRTADGLGIDKVYLTGYTPWPATKNDSRLPHLRDSVDRRIHKAALGAEDSVAWERCENLSRITSTLRREGFTLAALEQSNNSIPIISYRPPDNLALVVGSETHGIQADELKQCDVVLEILMKGKKESFNVAVAAAIALFQLSRF